MEHIDVTKLKALKNGEGMFGKCFILDNDTLIKDYFNLEEDLMLKKDEVDAIGISNDTFIYAIDAHFENNYLSQTKLKYVHASTLKDLNYNISINNLIKAIDKLYEDTIIISDMRIKTSEDISDGNILFDDRNLYIIDRDDDIKDIFNEKECLRDNLSEINTNFREYIISDIWEVRKKNFEFIEKNAFLKLLFKELKANSSNGFLLKEFLYEYKRIINKYFKEELDNLNDIHKHLIRR